MGYQFDPNAQNEVLGFWSSIYNSMIETYTDPAAYEEFFAGAIMGAMGAPIFMAKNSRGKRSMFEGGIYGAIMENREIEANIQAVIDSGNKILENREADYRGIIRHDVLEKDSEQFLVEGDKFKYLNAKHAQLISQLITYQKMGKLQDLIDYYQGNVDKLSTTDKVEIAELAKELKLLTTEEVDKNSENNPNLFGNMTDEEIVQTALKTNQQAVEKIKEYSKITNDLTSLIGDKFTDKEAFHEMVYLYSAMKDFEVREKELTETVTEKLRSLKIPKIKVGKNNKERKKSKPIDRTFDININGETKNLTMSEIVEQADIYELLAFVYGEQTGTDTYNPGNNYIQELLQKDQIKEIGEKSKNEKEEILEKLINDPVSIFTFGQELRDLNRIKNARSKLLNTYNTFISNPELLDLILEADKQEAAAKKEVFENQPLIDKVYSAKNVQELRKIVREEKEKDPESKIDSIVDSMTDVNSPHYSKTAAAMRMLDNYFDTIKDTNAFKNLKPQYQDLVQELYARAKDLVNDRDELLQSETYDGLTDDFKIGNQSLKAEEHNEIINGLINALEEINANENRFQSLKRPVVATTEKGEITSNNKGMNNFNSGAIQTENNTISEQNIKDTQKQDEIQIKTEKSWQNGVFEIDIDEFRKTGKIILQENSTDPAKANYKAAAEFLREKGTFRYINAGKLQRGAKIRFMASPEYWERLSKQEGNAEYVENNKPLLLVVEDEHGEIESNGKKYQIVGTFKKELNTKLHDKVIGDYNAITKNQNNEQTTVTPTENTETSTKTVHTIQGENYNSAENKN